MMLSALCLLTVSAKAQTITAESVMKVYNDAVLSKDNGFAYNADIEDGLLTAQYVYQKETVGTGRKARVELRPYVMYRYEYDDMLRLTRRTTFWWDSFERQWQRSYRLDYTYEPGRSIVECRRWNKTSRRFVDADEKTVYELNPDGSAGRVCSYHRERTESSYKLTSQVTMPATLLYGDELLTHQER